MFLHSLKWLQTYLLGVVLVGVSTAVIRHYDYTNLGRKEFISAYSVVHPSGKSEQTLRGHWGALFTGFFLMACTAYFLIYPRTPTCPWVAPPQRGGLSTPIAKKMHYRGAGRQTLEAFPQSRAPLPKISNLCPVEDKSARIDVYMYWAWRKTVTLEAMIVTFSHCSFF